jgi:capsid protein
MNWFRNMMARTLLRILARYDAAGYSPQRSILSTPYQGARFDANASSRAIMASKMRELERNDPLVQALAGKFENYVVGSNPQLTPNSSDPAWNQKAKVWWDDWCNVCDLTSRQPFGVFLGLAARRWFIEGDTFIILTSGKDSQGTMRPRVQMVESHLCRTPDEYKDDPLVHDGVRMDAFGRPVAYYFADEPKANQFVFGPPRTAANVIPVMEPERPGEVRGITHFHACINEIHDIGDLHILEMQAAKENASTTDWVETDSGELDPATLRRQLLQGTAISSNGTAHSAQKIDYYRDISGGRTRVLQRGDKIHQHSGERPSVTTTDYWRLKRELVCTAVEIPYCLVFPDSMQGTVYRGALAMATSAFKSRHAVIADVQKSIWGYVMSWAIATERGLASPPADWRKVSIQAPRTPDVDVGRNSAANIAEIAAGVQTFQGSYGALGLDYATQLRQRAIEAALIRSLAAEYGVEVGEISNLAGDQLAQMMQAESSSAAMDPNAAQGDLQDA